MDDQRLPPAESVQEEGFEPERVPRWVCLLWFGFGLAIGAGLAAGLVR